MSGLLSTVTIILFDALLRAVDLNEVSANMYTYNSEMH